MILGNNELVWWTGVVEDRDDPEKLRPPRREQQGADARPAEGPPHLHRQDPRALRREGKTSLGPDGELQLLPDRH